MVALVEILALLAAEAVLCLIVPINTREREEKNTKQRISVSSRLPSLCRYFFSDASHPQSVRHDPTCGISDFGSLPAVAALTNTTSHPEHQTGQGLQEEPRERLASITDVVFNKN